jgi:hypothetical protein
MCRQDRLRHRHRPTNKRGTHNPRNQIHVDPRNSSQLNGCHVRIAGKAGDPQPASLNSFLVTIAITHPPYVGNLFKT